MKAAILVSAGVSSLVSIIATIVALNVLAPAVVEAQETQIRAESVWVVDESGTGRVRMATGAAGRSSVNVLSQQGVTRVAIGTGGGDVGAGGTQRDQAYVRVFAPEGGGEGSISIASLGTGAGGDGSRMRLADHQGQSRIWLGVDGDGNPSIRMLDASGNVTWSAP